MVTPVKIGILFECVIKYWLTPAAPAPLPSEL